MREKYQHKVKGGDTGFLGILVLFCVFCLSPYCSAGLGLLLGIGFALFVGNPFEDATATLAKKLLPLVVIGLGASIKLSIVWTAISSSFFITFAVVLAAMFFGRFLRGVLRCDNTVGVLISVGTAICGGSAIAAIAPIIQAKSEDISVSIGVVFLLNGLALFIFPWLGAYFELSQSEFGLWSAVAIHDTSSVVGATMQFGQDSLEIGTTTKLVRTIWIVPLAIYFAYSASRGKPKGELKKPWFILGFLAMSAVVSFVPSLQPYGELLSQGAKRILVLVLFFIGLSLSVKRLKTVGFTPIIYGVFLWSFIATLSLVIIKTA